MKTLWGDLRLRVLGLASEETGYSRRGFRGATEEMRGRLEQVGAVFLLGYHAALERSDSAALVEDLNAVDLEWRGFAFEGAGMGLALIDQLSPWRRTRLESFLQGAGDAHTYMVHVGVGWVWARVSFGFRRAQRRLHPLFGWLAFDGWGFHEGFFAWPKYFGGQPAPPKLSGYERRVFDQGLGRSLWFVDGGNTELIARTISKVSADRQADLWCGIGLAATYAGIASETSLAELRRLAGIFQPQLAQGAAFAAKARQRAANLTDYTSRATQVLCGMSAEDAARITDVALEHLPADSEVPAYEVWRRRIQAHFLAARQLQEA